MYKVLWERGIIVVGFSDYRVGIEDMADSSLSAFTGLQRQPTETRDMDDPTNIPLLLKGCCLESLFVCVSSSSSYRIFSSPMSWKDFAGP